MANTRPDDWRLKSAQRLQESRARQPDPYQDAPVAKATQQGASSLALDADRRMKREHPSIAGHPGQPIAPGLEADIHQASFMTSQRQYHRTESGLRASTFEPQQHTVIVEGRPIQVRTTSVQSKVI